MNNSKDLSILFGRQFNGVGHCGTYKNEDFRLYFWGHNQIPLVLIIPYDGDIAVVDKHFNCVECVSTEDHNEATFYVYDVMMSYVSEIEMFEDYANIIFSNNDDSDCGQREVGGIQISGDYKVIRVDEE
jgi:hypothetical protein